MKKEGKRILAKKLLNGSIFFAKNEQNIISPEQSRRIYNYDGSFRLTLYPSNLR